MAEQQATRSTLTDRRALLEAELQRYLLLLQTEYEPEKVILCGSLAADEVGEWADIDLVVVTETDRRFLDRIKDVLRLLQPRVGVDVLVYTPQEYERLVRERPFVRYEIEGQGGVLYKRGR